MVWHQTGAGAGGMRGGGTRKGRDSSLVRDQHHRLTALLQISAVSHNAGIPTAEVEELSSRSRRGITRIWKGRTQLQKPSN